APTRPLVRGAGRTATAGVLRRGGGGLCPARLPTVSRWRCPPARRGGCGTPPGSPPRGTDRGPGARGPPPRGGGPPDRGGGGQVPQTGLGGAGRGQRRIDHVEGQVLGEFAEVAGGEPAPGHGDRACGDRLGIQRSSCYLVILVDTVLARTPLPVSTGWTAALN